MRYVEEDDQEREECAGEADEDDEPELREVRQCRDPQLGSTGGEEAGQTGHGCHLEQSKYGKTNTSRGRVNSNRRLVLNFRL